MELHDATPYEKALKRIAELEQWKQESITKTAAERKQTARVIRSAEVAIEALQKCIPGWEETT